MRIYIKTAVLAICGLILNACGEDPKYLMHDDRPLKVALPTYHDGIEDVPIWKLVLQTTTASVDNADTDGRIRARLKLRSGGTVELDSQWDDREKGHTDIHVINPWSVRKVADIEMLELYTSSNDGWCIDNLSLKVNDDPLPLFESHYSPCFWIDGDGTTSTLPISGDTLRRHPGWTIHNRGSILHPPDRIDREELELMIEGAVGNAIGELNHFDWGKLYGYGHVEVRRAGQHSSSVDLDLHKVYGNWPHKNDQELDLDFNITWRCTDGELDFDIQNVRLPNWLDNYGMHRDKGRIVRSVEDSLLRLKLMTASTGYECEGNPLVQVDGDIATRLAKRASSWNASMVFGDLVYNDKEPPPTSIEDIPVWDLVLEVETGSADDAKCDDKVVARVGHEEMSLNLSHDDREIGSIDRYHLSFPAVDYVADIKQLEIALARGEDDRWCVGRLALYLNGERHPIFERSYASCVWVRSDRKLTYTGDELRAHVGWRIRGHDASMWTPPEILTPSLIAGGLESAIGASTRWQEGAVSPVFEVDRGSGRSIYVRAKYITKHSTGWYDTLFDATFDIEVLCGAGSDLEFKIRNLGANVSGPVEDDSDYSGEGVKLAVSRWSDTLSNITKDYRCTEVAKVIDFGNLAIKLEKR